MRIYHLGRREDWTAAIEGGLYEWSTRGATLDEVGFIHCSTPEQLAEVAERVFGSAPDDLVVLELDDETVRGAGTDVRYEDGGNGTLYPHIYGAIETSWVLDIRQVSFDREGRFQLDIDCSCTAATAGSGPEREAPLDAPPA